MYSVSPGVRAMDVLEVTSLLLVDDRGGLDCSSGRSPAFELLVGIRDSIHKAVCKQC